METRGNTKHQSPSVMGNEWALSSPGGRVPLKKEGACVPLGVQEGQTSKVSW